MAALLALLVCLGSLCALSGCADTGTPENSTEDTSSAVAEVTGAPEVTVENALSVLGLLSRFVGMLTDSRSFLSYPRHEYFRRLLCNLLGNDVEKGLLPNDMESLSRMVEDISYNNARNYFKFY